MFDSEMSMKAHVSLITRSAYPQLNNSRVIKPFLDIETANTTTHAFVSSHLDAGNASFIWYCTMPTSTHTENTEHGS